MKLHSEIQGEEKPPQSVLVFNYKINNKMETNKENKNWGGKREGAGRKKTTSKSIALRIPEDVVEILDNVENRSAFIIEAIRQLARQKK